MIAKVIQIDRRAPNSTIIPPITVDVFQSGSLSGQSGPLPFREPCVCVFLFVGAHIGAINSIYTIPTLNEHLLSHMDRRVISVATPESLSH